MLLPGMSYLLVEIPYPLFKAWHSFLKEKSNQNACISQEPSKMSLQSKLLAVLDFWP